MSNTNKIVNYAEKYFERNKNIKDLVTNPTIYLKKLLKNEKIETICEVGCFTGIQLNYLCNELNCEGIGIDASEKSILKAKKKYKNILFEQGVSTNLELEDDSIDLLCFGFFLYILSDKDYNKSIEQAKKKLKKGKFFYIFDFDSISKKKCKHDNNINITKRDHSYIKGFKLLEKKTYYELFNTESKFSYTNEENRMSLWLFKKL